MILRWFLVVLLMSPSALAQTSVIRAGNLIDPSTGKVSRNQVILVREGQIVEVGANVETPSDAEVVDLTDAWVMPGLMDAHTHITVGPPPNTSIITPYLSESSAFRALRGAKNARIMLEAGFTAAKDIGNDAEYAAVDVRRAIERGWFPGPTLLTTGKIIAPFGGQSTGVPPEQGHFWRHEYVDADTPDEVRKAVRRNIYYGANSIKLVSDHNAYFYSREAVEAAVEESHGAGLTCSIHVYGGEAARNVILGGADSIEHGFYLSDELLRLMKEKGTILVGTDFPEEHLKLMAFNQVTDGQTLGQHIIDRLRRAHRIGVKMAFGTDVFLAMPDKNIADMMFEYLDVWTAAGVPHADILKAMTTNVAELFGWQGKRGAIAVGEAADIIATDRSPLENIQALKQVRFVMKNGTVVRNDF